MRQAYDHYALKFGEDGARNIFFIYRGTIVEAIFAQLMRHMRLSGGLFAESIADERRVNRRQTYDFEKCVDLYENFKPTQIQSVLFTGIDKGVFDAAKFDSMPELKLARLMEQDSAVEKWLRPAPNEFDIRYEGNRQYEPDFVVETRSMKFLIEVKGLDLLDDADVIAKRARAVEYCRIASTWSRANGAKEWRHLFIPADKIHGSASFESIAKNTVVDVY